MTLTLVVVFDLPAAFELSQRYVPVMRVDVAKLAVAGTVTLTTTGMKSSPVAGSERVIFAV